MSAMLSGWLARLRKLPAPATYAVGLAFEKALSFVTVPLVAHFLAPGDYGRYDVALSLLDGVSLVVGCCLGETMVRFVSEAVGSDERDRRLSGFLFSALVTTLVSLVLVQLAAVEFAKFLGISDNTAVVRLSLACTTLTAPADVALVWLRLADRADLFLLFTTSRALCQTLATWLALVLGFGAEGILVAGSIVTIFFVAGVFFAICAKYGVRPSRFAFERQLFYGVPLVGAGLAMFALGNCNRWFLRPYVAAEEIGYLGMASRLMLLAPLLMQPFTLWWQAQRFIVLFGPDGPSRTRRLWSLGVSLTILTATAVAIAGPLAIGLLLPGSYARASVYLPFVLLAFGVNQLCLFSSVGTASRGTGHQLFAIDAAGALLALVTYAILVPSHGVFGAIGGLIAGHGLRLLAYLYFGARESGLVYPLPAAALSSVVACLCVAMAPAEAHTVARMTWAAMTILILAVILNRQGLLWTPDFILDNLRPIGARFLRLTTGREMQTIQMYLADLVRDKSVLDVGCVDHDAGKEQVSDAWLHKHLRRTARSIVGLDLSEQGVSELSARGYDVVCGDATTVSLGKKFDVVMAGEIIEHVDNPGQFLANLAKHLAPGGILVVTTPNPFYALHMFEGTVLKDPGARWNEQHVSWFCPFTLKNLAERAGLVVDRVGYFARSSTVRSLLFFRSGSCPAFLASTFAVVLRARSDAQSPDAHISQSKSDAISRVAIKEGTH
ncbi:MAG: methyltransferase domain-containing protein [Proteobacteria bacterium]|nr:methyltransferase domain-containing protein [Pseudomonadota bacterium]